MKFLTDALETARGIALDNDGTSFVGLAPLGKSFYVSESEPPAGELVAKIELAGDSVLVNGKAVDWDEQ